jgi:hypothetical protein
MPLLGIKPPPLTRHLDEELGRGEPRRPIGVQSLQRSNQSLSPERIRVPKRSATKRREADAEHRSDVPVARRPENSVLQAANGFIDHREHAAALNLVCGQFSTARA